MEEHCQVIRIPMIMMRRIFVVMTCILISWGGGRLEESDSHDDGDNDDDGADADEI